MAGPRLTGPRLTAPAARLARHITTTAHSSTAPATLITSSRASAPLSHKYAELLKEKNMDGDHSRHIYTRSSNRPHPAPRRMRLMQTFTSSATRPAQVGGMDKLVLPDMQNIESQSASRLRVPILPDNYDVHNAPLPAAEPVLAGQINVVAADPEKVSVSALTEVEGMNLDGVELKFAHEAPKKQSEPGMLRDLWKGLVDDVLGGKTKPAF